MNKYQQFISNSSEKTSTMKASFKKKTTFIVILFSLILLCLGITAGITFSAFSSQANVSGTISFSINGHKGEVKINNADIDGYNVEGITYTEFTISPNTGYAVVPGITLTPYVEQNSEIVAGSPIVLTPGSANTEANVSGHSYTYNGGGIGTLKINNLSILGISNFVRLEVTGSANSGEYTVTYNLNGGNIAGDDSNPTATATFGQESPVLTGTTAVPSKDGYAFGGYFTGENGTGAIYYTSTGASTRLWDIASATTLYAYWVEEAKAQHIVYFDSQDATGLGTVVALVTEGSAMPTITLPIKTGSEFGGYFTGINGTGTQYYSETGESLVTYNLTTDLILYAKWKLPPITYHMNANGLASTLGLSGTSTESTYIDELAENYVIPTELQTSNMQTKIAALLPQDVAETTLGSLYTFDGWYTTKNFANNSKITNPASPGFSEETDLYAKWIINSDNASTFTSNVLKLESDGIHKIEDNYSANTSLTNVVIPAEISGSAVTDIAYYGLYGCSNLTSITIPSSVTNIGDYAFNNCSSLTSITIPSSVTSIGEYAFCNCSNLTSITIPSSVTSIGRHAFSGCTGLTTIIVDSNNTNYDSRNNCNAIIETSTNTLLLGCKNTTIPNSVTSIGNSAFSDCSGLTSIEIPNGVTSIGDYAFSSCSGLTSVEISNGVTSIGDSAFSSCSNLTNIAIPNSITSVGGGAFSGLPEEAYKTMGNAKYLGYMDGDTFVPTILVKALNSSIESCVVENTCKVICDSAFYECSLSSITIPDSVVAINDYAFYYCYNLSNFSIGNGLMSVPAGVFEYLPSEAFTTINNAQYLGYMDGETFVPTVLVKGNYGIESCVVENTCNLICPGAFTYSNNLTSVTIGSGVRSIGERVFYGCSSLTTIIVDSNNTKYDSRNNCNAIIETSTNTLVLGCKATTIPNSVTSIGERAFYGCSGLTSITIPNSVTSIGDYAFYSCGNLTSIEIPNSVTSIGSNAFYRCSNLTSITIPDSVTSIGDYAFNYCSSLTSIEIPNSVTSIGERAFEYCSGLTSITIGSGVTSIGYMVFSHCSGLTSITIPNSVTSIGERAFSECTGLTSITIPNSVTSIGDYAFYSCRNLTSIEIPNSVTSIGADAFSSAGLTSITIPSSVTSIGSAAFSYCSGLTSITFGENSQLTSIGYMMFSGSGLTSITIPNSVTSIGGSAFYDCSGLTSITIPSSVTSIGASAFYNCSNLTSITIPSSVTSIGDSAFRGCSGLTSITIPSSVTSIGDSAFSGCTGLTTIIVDSNNTKYDSRNNCNAIIETSTNTLLLGCKATTIPNSVTSIGGSAFNGCSGLTSITIPNGVTSIGASAFSGCTGLTSITIPNSVTSIGRYAFNGCSGLTSITIPSSVTSIGGYAFSNTGLTEAIFEVKNGWEYDNFGNKNNIDEDKLSNAADAANYLKNYSWNSPAGYANYDWTRN